MIIKECIPAKGHAGSRELVIEKITHIAMKIDRFLSLATLATALALLPVLSTKVSAQDAVTVNESQLDIEVERFTLSNGLTVIVNPDPRTQQVGVFVSYHVGLRDEEPGQLEYSHLFEHLMFTGSQNNPDEYFSVLEPNGVSSLNAYTAPDFTSYMQMAPRGALDLVLFAESDRMAYFRDQITQAKIDVESEIVINEHRERAADPFFRLFTALNEGIYPVGHPYYARGEQLIADMRAAELDDVLDWYDRFYGPNNAVLGLTGNITVGEARELAERYFGHIEPVAAITRPYEFAEPTVGYNSLQINHEGPDNMYGRTAMLPPTRDREVVLLNLATLFLNSDETNSLQVILADQESLVTNVSLLVNPGEVSSNMILIAGLQDGVEIDTVRRRIQELVQGVPDVLDDEAFELVKARFVEGFISEVEALDPLSIVSGLAEDYLTTGNPMHKQDVIDIALEATREEVLDAWSKWMTQGAFEIRMVAQPIYASSGPDTLDRSSLPVVETPGEVAVPEASIFELDNGVEVTYYQVPFSNTLNLTLSTPGGLDSAVADQSGLAALTLEAMMSGGIGGRAPEIVAGEIFDAQLQMTPEVQATQNQFILTIPERYMSQSLSLVGEMLSEPNFDADALQLLVSQRQSLLDGIWTLPTEASNFMVGQLLFGTDSPDALNVANQISPVLLNNVTRDDLVAYWEKWFSPQGAKLVAVGGIDAAELKQALETGFQRWQGQSASPSSSESVPRETDLKPGQIYVVDLPGAEQSSIDVLLPRESFRGLEYTRDTVLSEILLDVVGASFNSRLSENIRKTKGWTYGVSGAFEEILGQNILRISTSVQTDKTADTITEIIREFEEVASVRPITQDEFDRSIGVINGYPLQYYGDTLTLGVALPWLVTDDYDADYFNKLSAATEPLLLEDVNAYAQRSGLNPQNFTWVIAGDRAAIEADLTALGISAVEILERP